MTYFNNNSIDLNKTLFDFTATTTTGTTNASGINPTWTTTCPNNSTIWSNNFTFTNGYPFLTGKRKEIYDKLNSLINKLAIEDEEYADYLASELEDVIDIVLALG